MDAPVTLITGTRIGIGRHLAEHYLRLGHRVVGCSRNAVNWTREGYKHYGADVADEKAVKAMFSEIRRSYGRLDHLINNAGIASMNHSPLTLAGEAAYVASKSAVVALTHVLAREFAEYGVTVNCIGPGPLATNLIRSVPKQKIDRLLEQQAIPRMGTFEDVANTVDFFLRPESGFVTGQTIYLGGV